jgi:hypothetical protein
MKVKKTLSLLFILILLFSWSAACADRQVAEKDQYYLGAMRVVKAKQYVSLREGPYKKSKQLAKIEPGEIVYSCSRNEKEFAYSPYRHQVHWFTKCVYDGQEGYVMSRYLEPAPEYEPVETKAENRKMDRDEIIGDGEVILEWTEFNVSVVAGYEVMTEKEGETPWETLRIGCFIDGEPEWGYVEQAQKTGEGRNLTAFIGGTEDEPQVYIYDAEYGLIMLDLIDGSEQWELSKDVCELGDCSVVTAGANTGILYAAGSDGPDPVAISAEGNVLWRSVIDDPEIYGPREIILNPNDIEVHYDCGKSVKLEYNGELISISDL